MTKKKTNPKEECQGRYYVKGYETDDGKKVEGYYRTCWKHGTQGNGGSIQASDTEDGGIYPKRMPEKGNEGLPAPEQNPQGNGTGNNNHPVLDTIWTILGTAPEIFAKYMEYKAEADKRQIYYAPVRQNYLAGADNSSYLDVQPSPSKFDPKKTSENIKEAMENVGGLLNKKEITTDDIGNIKGNLLNSIKTICNDMEYLSEKKAQLPQNPTIESVEESINIDNDRKQTRENIYQSILMMYQANKALDKNFEPVNTSDSDYGEKFKNYLHEKEDFKRISDNLSSLYDITENINDNTNGKIERVKENLGIQDSTYNNITGGADNIYNKLAFEDVYIPLENDNDNQTTLQGHVEKSDDYLREINYELNNIEKQKEYEHNKNLKLKKYSEINRFNRLKELIDALFYVIRNENISPNEKIYQFKNEIKNELHEYDQSTYPKRRISRGNFLFSLNDIYDAYIIWKYNKQEGDWSRLLMFLRCLWLWKETNKKLEEFYAKPEINIREEEYPIKNDMRHITGLVFYTQRYGETQARKYGYLKEKLDFYQEGDIKDTLIDFDNNEIGIAFGMKYKNLSKEETIEKIYDVFIKPKRKRGIK